MHQIVNMNEIITVISVLLQVTLFWRSYRACGMPHATRPSGISPKLPPSFGMSVRFRSWSSTSP